MAKPPFEVLGKPTVREYEDTLQLVIEFDHVLSKPERAKLSSLYDRWCRDVRVESNRADDDPDDAVDLYRFEPLFIGDRAVSGGASRFISATQSSAALVDRLAKLRGVTRVTFGDPPDPTPPLPTPPPADEPPAKFAKLELYDDEHARMATLCFAITLFSAKPLQQSPRAVLACWDAFRSLMGPNRLTLWGTETTAPINKKPVTASTLELLTKWLAKTAPKREYLAIELGDGPTYKDASRWQFNVWSTARADAGHFVRLSLPYHVALTRADELATLTQTLFATNAFRSAQAGPAWNTGCFSPSRRAGNADEHAVALSTKYPAIDLMDVVNDANTVKADGLKGVAWLTLLDAKHLAEISPRGLPRSITITPAGTGTMFRCGPLPTLDARSGERDLVKKLAPLIARTLPRTRWLHVASDDEVKSLGFRVRLAPWPELALCARASPLGDQLLRAIRESEAAARTAWANCARALRALAAIKLGPTPLDHRSARAELIQHQIADIYTKLGYAHVAAKPAFALWLCEQALRLPNAPASLYADLRVRQDPDYILGGAIPSALAAGDLKALRRLVGPAAARANEQPDIHHALARAYVVLGDHPRALHHVAAAIATYPDAKALRDEKSLSPLHGPAFKALFRKPTRA